MNHYQVRKLSGDTDLLPHLIVQSIIDTLDERKHNKKFITSESAKCHQASYPRQLLGVRYAGQWRVC